MDSLEFTNWLLITWFTIWLVFRWFGGGLDE